MTLYKLTLSFLLLSCVCCSDFPENKSHVFKSIDQFPDSIKANYHSILDGLKLGYVPLYRGFQVQGTDLKSWRLPENDSLFQLDSIRYWDSYHNFFKQESTILEWLLTYKNDINNSDLWSLYQNPYSSYIGECYLDWNNSRAAVNLIQNYLYGIRLECIECGYRDSAKCTNEQYERVEEFLRKNYTTDHDQLRQKWMVFQSQ